MRYRMLLLREEYFKALKLFEDAMAGIGSAHAFYVEYARRSAASVSKALAQVGGDGILDHRQRTALAGGVRTWRMNVSVLMALGGLSTASGDPVRESLARMEGYLDEIARLQRGTVFPRPDSLSGNGSSEPFTGAGDESDDDALDDEESEEDNRE